MLTVNELFAGIGAFRKALNRLGIPFKIVGISEIDKYAVASYEAIYGNTRNYGDISEIEKLDYADLWTYGFPCQDISITGLKKGIIPGETRSGLLYEVQRLLARAASDHDLPKYLIMENVKNLVGRTFRKDFENWVNWLDSIGYQSFWKTINAADYDIPQKRERVFVVSIRKDLPISKTFRFPDPLPQTVLFRDLLEDNPGKKYFLTEETVEYYKNQSEQYKQRDLGFLFSPVTREDCKISKTLSCKADRKVGNYIDEQKDC